MKLVGQRESLTMWRFCDCFFWRKEKRKQLNKFVRIKMWSNCLSEDDKFRVINGGLDENDKQWNGNGNIFLLRERSFSTAAYSFLPLLYLHISTPTYSILPLFHLYISTATYSFLFLLYLHISTATYSFLPFLYLLIISTATYLYPSLISTSQLYPTYLFLPVPYPHVVAAS